MRARDVMTTNIVAVGPDTDVATIARRLIERRISAVPVVDLEGRVVGIVSEGDLMRRPESGTERRPSWWLALLAGSGGAREYVRSHGVTAKDVMTREVITCSPGTPVPEIASTMARHHLRRLPVVENDLLVGIVSRADVLRAAESRPAIEAALPPLANDQIRTQLLESLQREPWTEVDRLRVEVSAGQVVLRGLAESTQEREAIELAARAIAGVTDVVNELAVAPDFER